ncbi:MULTISPECIES: hypothetical protein [Streptomyces]|uniref:TolA protein n=1 Tax=Streptomyces solicathayae TaxID=3081768 RepID=A0ABZ0LKR3_9ACTN|nr:hypothetical protein [Streptomyces sp. HUAS YS2]WOX20112.1 hypothetical protein R2D22_01365 [Streptomyces sp. HUAS YS2]
MDVDEVIDDLYRLKPSDFTAARDAYVAQARQAKDSVGARRIAALRRPTLPAWASNLLVRTRPAEAEQLLALGRALREAHRTLDPAQLRGLSRQQNHVIAVLVRDAAALAEQAGQPVGGRALDEVGHIMRTVLADPEAAEIWVQGRLVRSPEPTVGFTAITPDTVPPRAAPAPKEGPKTKERPEPKERPKPTPRSAPPEPTPSDASRARREARLEQARAAAGDAEAEARRLEAEFHEAESRHREADARATAAADRVTALDGQLREAREEQREARTEATRTAGEARAAERAAKAAQRAAGQAAQALKRLEDGASHT